jgi:MFS family permease
VREPEIYVQTREAEKEGAPVAVEHGATRNPLLQIFQPDLLGITLPATVMAIGAQGGYYAIFTWLPTFLKTSLHLSIVGSVPYISIVILGSFLGYVISGYVNDRPGRKLTFMIFAICSAIMIFLYTHIPAGANSLLLVLGLPLGFFASGIFSGFGSFLAELYPTRARGAGQSFVYNFGRGVGGVLSHYEGRENC